MAKLSAFADEVIDCFMDQVKYLQSEKVGYIEPRFFDNKKNIMDLSQREIKEAKIILDDHGMKVSAIGSPIGKVKLDSPFEAHLDKFKHAVDLATFFDTPLIRMFSYYAPEGKNIDDYRDEVFERMEKKLEIIKGTKVVMVHENEQGIYGHNAENCVDLAKTLDSPNFKLAYDPANFVWGESMTNNVDVCWPLMKPYVVHIHIKDWTVVAKDIGSMPGEGDGQIKELLQELAKINYQGCMTMEPHLQAGGQFSGDTGPELFSKAIARVRKLSSDVGLACD